MESTHKRAYLMNAKVCNLDLKLSDDIVKDIWTNKLTTAMTTCIEITAI